MVLQTGSQPSHSMSVTLCNTTLNMLFPSSSEHWKLEPEEKDYPAEYSLTVVSSNAGSSGGTAVNPSGSGHGAPSAAPVSVGSSGSVVNPGGNSGISSELSALRQEWRREVWPYPARTVNLDPKNCLENREAAKVFLEDANQALKYLLHVNTELGAQSARLEYTGSNLITQSHMLESADSELRDANVATETLNFAKSNVLMNSSESLLAQANQAAGSVTGLLVS